MHQQWNKKPFCFTFCPLCCRIWKDGGRFRKDVLSWSRRRSTDIPQPASVHKVLQQPSQVSGHVCLYPVTFTHFQWFSVVDSSTVHWFEFSWLILVSKLTYKLRWLNDISSTRLSGLTHSWLVFVIFKMSKTTSNSHCWPLLLFMQHFKPDCFQVNPIVLKTIFSPKRNLAFAQWCCF